MDVEYDWNTIRAAADEGYTRWFDRGPRYRGRQKPRDRDSVLLLIEMAVASWKKAEEEGLVRWREDGVLEIRTRPLPPASENSPATPTEPPPPA